MVWEGRESFYCRVEGICEGWDVLVLEVVNLAVMMSGSVVVPPKAANKGKKIIYIC